MLPTCFDQSVCNRQQLINRHLTGLFHEKVTIVTCIYTALKVKGKRAPTQLQHCVASAVRPISLVHLYEALLAQKEARCAHVHRKSKVDVYLEKSLLKSLLNGKVVRMFLLKFRIQRPKKWTSFKSELQSISNNYGWI